MPVIGVAKAGWNLDQLKARAKESLEKHSGLDPAAFHLALRAVALCGRRLRGWGDISSHSKELGVAQRPAHYLAIPPVLFGTVVEQLGKSGCAPAGERVVVEKPFGRDLESARPTRHWMAIFHTQRQRIFALLPNSFSLISSGVAIMKRSPHFRFLQDFLQDTLKTSSPRSMGREERPLPLVNDCIGRRLLDGRQNREGKA